MTEIDSNNSEIGKIAIDRNNPEINVDELMAKVREEVARRQARRSRSSEEEESNGWIENSIRHSRFDAFLEEARQKSKSLERLPKKLDRFPFNTWLVEKIILKIYNFIFREQKAINLALIDALEEIDQMLEYKERVLNEKLKAAEKAQPDNSNESSEN